MAEILVRVTELESCGNELGDVLAAFSARRAIGAQQSRLLEGEAVMMTSSCSGSMLSRTLIFQSLDQAIQFLSFWRQEVKHFAHAVRVFEAAPNADVVHAGGIRCD
ncbi:MAG: hypothetical protein Q8R02_24030 [Hyphomonadaceae bacterium]|nr:hypothetical protein [Hyphomonadaceae bacterium]